MVAQQHGARVGVDGVDCVVFRDHVHHVVRALVASGCDVYAGDHERLGVYLIVQVHRMQRPELREVDIRGRQHGLGRIPAGTISVVVISGYRCLRDKRNCVGKKEDEGQAGNFSQPADAGSAMKLCHGIPRGRERLVDSRALESSGQSWKEHPETEDSKRSRTGQ
jgi:hypothetical protein